LAVAGVAFGCGLEEAVRQQVRDGKILAHVVLKFSGSGETQSLEDCLRTAVIFVQGS
jgi:hypothetical protein